jgi:uncharacterized protein YjeT (DUF2065 family)
MNERLQVAVLVVIVVEGIFRAQSSASGALSAG